MRTDDFYKKLLDSLYDGVYFVDAARKITYWNRGAERITGYTAHDMVGRSCQDNLLMHSDRNGRVLCECQCPLTEAMVEGRDRSDEIYLRHRDGHRVPVSVRVSPITDDEGNIAGAVEIFSDATPAAVAYDRLAELEKLAYLDALTGLGNRRYAEITLEGRLDELHRYGWLFGVLFIDIDRFKDVNDVYGHPTGDEVLKTVARTLQNSVRSFDVVSRWGGEEYLAVIVNVQPDELLSTANRCRALVQQSRMPSAPSLVVTVSVGATLAVPEDTIATLIGRVDELMYRSKRAGRNCVTADNP